MALTREILKSNTILAGLTDEQMMAIVTLSNNDESASFGARFSEVYRQMDETIELATGIHRDGAEKTYKYLERAVNEYTKKHSDYNSLKGKITELEADKAKLTKQIAEGTAGEEAIKNLNQAKADLKATKAQYEAIKAEYEASKVKYQADLHSIKVEGVIGNAMSSIRLKDGVNEQVAKLAKEAAIAKVKAMNPTFTDEGNLVFKNADGSTINNPSNQLNPYTAEELIRKELESYDILAVNAPKGTGGGSPKPDQTNSLLGATTKIQAISAIEKTLAQKGLVKGTLAYQNEFDKVYAENNVSALPMGE